MHHWLLALLLLSSPFAPLPNAFAQDAIVTAAEAKLPPEALARYRALINEIRCLVCQNQTIADSQATLAKDLKREVLAMVEAGQSDDEILDFLVTRYGDYVLYKPPVQGNTLLLWAGPGLLVLIGAVLFFRVVRARSALPPGDVPPVDEAEDRV